MQTAPADNVTPLKTATTPTATVGTTKDRIRSFIQRIERVEEEIKERQEDKKEIYSELKGEGFDGAIVKKLVALRKKDPEELAEQAELLKLYAEAAGNDQLSFLL